MIHLLHEKYSHQKHHLHVNVQKVAIKPVYLTLTFKSTSNREFFFTPIIAVKKRHLLVIFYFVKDSIMMEVVIVRGPHAVTESCTGSLMSISAVTLGTVVPADFLRKV